MPCPSLLLVSAVKEFLLHGPPLGSLRSCASYVISRGMACGGQSWPTTCNNRCAGRPAAHQNAACRPPSDRAAARRCRRPARRAAHGRQPGPDNPARCAPRRAARLRAPRSAGRASCTSCMTARRRETSSATCTSRPAARAAPRGAACARRARRPACASSRWGSWRAWRWSSCRTASRPPGCCARCRTTRARSSPRRPAPRFPTPRNVCPPTTAHVPVAARGTRAESALHEAITEAREQALPGSGAGAHQGRPSGAHASPARARRRRRASSSCAATPRRLRQRGRAGRAGVEFAEEDRVLSAYATPNDPDLPQQWALYRLGLFTDTPLQRGSNQGAWNRCARAARRRARP